MASATRPGAVPVKFDIKNPMFAVSVLTALFSFISLFNLQLPAPAADLANQAVSTFSIGGLWALGGWIVASLGGLGILLWQKLKAHELTIPGLLGNVNFWIILASLITSLALRFGLVLPADALGGIVMDIYQGRYIEAGGVFLSQVFNPLIRFIQSKRVAPAT